LPTDSQAFHRHFDHASVLDYPWDKVLSVPLTGEDDNVIARIQVLRQVRPHSLRPLLSRGA